MGRSTLKKSIVSTYSGSSSERVVAASQKITKRIENRRKRFPKPPLKKLGFIFGPLVRLWISNRAGIRAQHSENDDETKWAKQTIFERTDSIPRPDV